LGHGDYGFFPVILYHKPIKRPTSKTIAKTNGPLDDAAIENSAIDIQNLLRLKIRWTFNEHRQ
jgi:hypothetical protein